MNERIDGEWTRKLAWRVRSAIHDDQRILRMLQYRNVLDDCHDHHIAAAAIEAAQKWTWAALGLLRWLLADWTRPAAMIPANLCNEPTLTEALAAAGYTHRPATREEAGARTYARAIVDSEGRVVAVLRAGEAWAWLRERSEEGER